MLAPEQMTDDTLRANIALYREIRRSQPEDFTEEDRERGKALVAERDRRIALQDTLPDGIYVTRAWAHEPHKGLTWVRQHGRWERVTSAAEHAADDREDIKTPQTFYGIGWEKQIVPLAVPTQRTDREIIDAALAEHGYRDPRTNSTESYLARDVAATVLRLVRES